MSDNRTLKIVVIVALGGVAFAAVIVFKTIDLPQAPQASSVPSIASGRDPLDAELARCRALGPDDPVDAGCEAAWAESNRRFFGDGKPGR